MPPVLLTLHFTQSTAAEWCDESERVEAYALNYYPQPDFARIYGGDVLFCAGVGDGGRELAAVEPVPPSALISAVEIESKHAA